LDTQLIEGCASALARPVANAAYLSRTLAASSHRIFKAPRVNCGTVRSAMSRGTLVSVMSLCGAPVFCYEIPVRRSMHIYSIQLV